MNSLQKFTLALDARLGQFRLDLIADFAASTREEVRSVLEDGVLKMPRPMMGVSLAHDNISGYRVEKGAAFDEELKKEGGVN